MSTKIPKIVTGSDRHVEATWLVGGVVTPISDTAVVKFVLVSSDHQTVHTSVLTASRDETGADWPAGLAILVFPAAETAEIDYQGLAEVEMQVDEGAGDKLSGFFPVNIVRGNIR